MRKTSKFSQVEFFINRFPLLEKYKEEENYDILNQEFCAYQMFKDIQVYSEEGDVIQLDKLWLTLKDMKDPATGSRKFENLFKVAESILVIPHSNAAEERITLPSQKKQNIISTKFEFKRISRKYSSYKVGIEAEKYL